MADPRREDRRAGGHRPRPAAAYAHLVRAQARSQGQYRASFLLDAGLSALLSLVELAAVLAVFRVTPELGGFTLREVLLTAALCEFGFQLADLLVGNIERLAIYVRTGLMDAVLVRPLSPLGQLLATDLPFRKVGRAVQDAVVYVVVLVYADLDWTPARAVLAVIAPVAAAALFAAVFIAGASVAFWWIDSGEFANAFTYGGRTFAQYPVPLYPSWLRGTFAYGLGFAFAGYQPMLALCGRSDPLGTPAWLAWSMPVVAAIAWAAAIALWRTGIRHYRSTGS
ncbi:ABC-2 family transporter protein [Yinghuangia sp. ASG 101]|uniref:ABC transporter permease n=1 Tax=Yinghuangia sp. ASG 101 TaxID=2896848 RepID=UPI001E5652DB|nr:ABC-2 family transporter protein [Yinghuangia sp. ASG 101]UGQ13831.1 ABC-2 family transporter protein [Yinghuangia sp. ASG 101]